MPKLPEDFKEKYTRLLGKSRAQQFFNSINDSPKSAFRVNSLKENYCVSYEQEKEVSGVSKAYYGKINGQDPAWVSGAVYSQEPTAMFPALFVEARPGQKVLDLCAAPGGKSTAISEQLKGEGLLVANEISHTRAKVLRENLERWGTTNSLIVSEKPEKLAQCFPHYFDKILVDAPCSGEGMFRKNPQAIKYWSQNYVLLCQERQKEILNAAVQMLKPEGEIVYSTCTYSPEENEQIVSWLSQKFNLTIMSLAVKTHAIAHGHPEWADNNPDLIKTVRFWPTADLGEGQFAAKLKLSPNVVVQAKISPNQKKKKKRRPQKEALTKSEIQLIAEVLDKFNLPAAIKNWRLNSRVRNNHVFIPALSDSANLNLQILANGVELGVLKKNRFEPGHQLAMVLAEQKQNRVVELSRESYLKYLHGETLRTQANETGFVLVSCQNFILGFGKISNHIIKNYYPKGLRV